MSDEPPRVGTGSALLLNSPLSEQSLDRIVGRACDQRPNVIVDHGCGWGEVLLRALLRCPQATGIGVEQHEPDIRRAMRAAQERGLDDQVTFVCGSSLDNRQPADLTISMGAYQAFGDIAGALSELRADTHQGGRLMFGAEFWRATPLARELELMWPGASLDDCIALDRMVELAHDAGWRLLDLHESTQSEFDQYELGHLREREEWLLAHPGHHVLHDLDEACTAWLSGRRRPLGFVTLILG